MVGEAVKQRYSQQEAPTDAEEFEVVGSSFEYISLRIYLPAFCSQCFCSSSLVQQSPVVGQSRKRWQLALLVEQAREKYQS